MWSPPRVNLVKKKLFFSPGSIPRNKNVKSFHFLLEFRACQLRLHGCLSPCFLFIHLFLNKYFFLAYCCFLNVGFLDCVGLELFHMCSQMCAESGVCCSSPSQGQGLFPEDQWAHKVEEHVASFSSQSPCQGSTLVSLQGCLWPHLGYAGPALQPKVPFLPQKTGSQDSPQTRAITGLHALPTLTYVQPQHLWSFPGER